MDSAFADRCRLFKHFNSPRQENQKSVVVQRIFSFMTMTMPIMELMYSPNSQKSNR